MLTGDNGILTQAQRAKEETEEAKIKEEGILGDYENYMDGATPSTLSEVKGKYFNTDTLLTVEGNKVLIPAGATVSGIDSESASIKGGSTTKDGGLVIYITNKELKDEEAIDWTNSEDVKKMQTTYDQFVWVPVEKAYVSVEEIGGDSLDNLKSYISSSGKYPMAIEISEGKYKGILYNIDEQEIGTLTITPYEYDTADSYREPDDVISDSSNNLTEDALQTQFNTMVTRVRDNGGFWVGRYETTNMSNNDTEDSTKKVTVIKGTTTGISNVSWYRMYNQQSNYKNLGITTEGTKITSSMIWGSQWDQIMLWMREIPAEYQDITYTKSYYVTNSIKMGNFGNTGVSDGWDNTSAPAPTGNSENCKVKNIYDLAGNIHDWTLEAGTNNYRITRRWRLRRHQ